MKLDYSFSKVCYLFYVLISLFTIHCLITFEHLFSLEKAFSLKWLIKLNKIYFTKNIYFIYLFIHLLLLLLLFSLHHEFGSLNPNENWPKRGSKLIFLLFSKSFQVINKKSLFYIQWLGFIKSLSFFWSPLKSFSKVFKPIKGFRKTFILGLGKEHIFFGNYATLFSL